MAKECGSATNYHNITHPSLLGLAKLGQAASAATMTKAFNL